MTPPWVRLARPRSSRDSRSRRTVDWETPSCAERVSRSHMPRWARKFWRRDWRSAINTRVQGSGFGVQVGLNALTRVRQLLRAVHFFEVGGAIGVARNRERLCRRLRL